MISAHSLGSEIEPIGCALRPLRMRKSLIQRLPYCSPSGPRGHAVCRPHRQSEYLREITIPAEHVPEPVGLVGPSLARPVVAVRSQPSTVALDQTRRLIPPLINCDPFVVADHPVGHLS
jgi:hypothetical protein